MSTLRLPLLMMLLLALTATSIADLWSHYRLSIAKHQQQQWRYLDQLPGATALADNARLLQSAISASPWSAEAYVATGDLGYWAIQPDARFAALANNGAAAYERAELLRPYWGETYILQALLLLKQHDPQAESESGLSLTRPMALAEQAKRSAPNEIQVMQSRFELYLAVWPQLDTETQLEAIDLFQVLVNDYGRGVKGRTIDVAEDYGMKLALCTVITTSERPPPYCR